MYKEFFGFKELPFNITPDSKFFFLSKHHREALGNLSYGITARKGFISISGEIGSGKTTLCRAIIQRFDPEKTKIAVIFNPMLSELELLWSINQEFGLEVQYTSKKDLIDELNKFLLAENSKDHNIVVIIDEAQNLSPELLEELRTLSNLETEKDKLLQIVLIGQPELNKLLSLPQLAQLNQRITVRYHLYPLDKDEVEKYIYHRINIAEPKVAIKFTKGAIATIYKYSGGIPRKINIVCDRALLAAYVAETTTIDETMVHKAIKELEIPELPVETVRTKKQPVVVKKRTFAALAYSVIVMVFISFVTLGFFLSEPSSRWLTYLNGYASGLITEVKQISLAPPAAPKVVAAPRPAKPTQDIQEQAESSAPAKPNHSEAPSAPSTSVALSEPKAAVTEETKSYHWDYDSQGFVRIADPELSYQASIINWLKLWNIPVNIKGLKDYDTAVIKSFELVSEGNSLGLQKFVTYLSLHDLITLDTPFILNIADQEKGLCPFVVLFQLTGDSAQIIDPVQGEIVLPLSYLNSKLIKSICLYFDSYDFTQMLKGEKSPRAEILQRILQHKGFYDGDITGIFDSQTQQAIEYLQQYFDLMPTGDITPPTALSLSLLQVEHYPTLSQEGKQDL